MERTLQKFIDQIIERSSHCTVVDGAGTPHAAVKAKMADLKVLATKMLTTADELEALKRDHHSCDGDAWYSCPKSEHGCADDSAGSECNCGAESLNAKIDALVKVLRG